MWEDPIVAEVHRTREKLAAQFNYDIKAIFADLMKRQVSLGARLVAPKKRAEQTVESGSDEATSTDAAPAA
ncbi:MAG: hypothetical protein FJ303_13505 [Planctomycetes bacterium]|nr:hypothetical protein [Planctomycetota bacterium]